MTIAAARDALDAAGYEASDASTDDRLYYAVPDRGDDDPEAAEALEELRSIVEPLGCSADWTGSGNTDARGVSTSDVAVTAARGE